MKNTAEELAKKFVSYYNDTHCTCKENTVKEHKSRIICEWDKKTHLITVHFEKNGYGLTNEFTELGKFVERLSKSANVYIVDAYVDALDDVYSITFSYKNKVKKDTTS